MQIKNEKPQPEKSENPMQERPSAAGDERDVLAAEAILTARRLEVQKDAERGTAILFVP